MKSLYINANCQGPALKAMLAEVLPDWRIESLAVHEKHTADALSDAAAFMRSADLVLSQPISDNYQTREFRSSSVREAERPTVWFPSIYFTGQLMTLCTLKAGGVRINAPGWLYHDRLVASAIVEGMDDSQIVELASDPESIPTVEIERHVAEVMAETERREEGCTIKMAPFFEQYLRSRAVCHSFNHPARFVLADVANRMLDIAGLPQRVKEDGPDHLAFPHFPIMPAVARYLGLKEDGAFHWASRSLTFGEYIRSMARGLRQAGVPTLQAALRELKPHEPYTPPSIAN